MLCINNLTKLHTKIHTTTKWTMYYNTARSHRRIGIVPPKEMVIIDGTKNQYLLSLFIYR